ncbi:small GTP-binding protein [Methanolinea mesophila]|uniref:GTP-binding protein n=1 Tax=Methanolinea mesophila TaxID=547055 RepID=UPI001AE7D0F0|nr:GTP-binding protein [Methanolinea mesophila]MBP1927646.1 small GTP-binding protein [Methanolinea mesophila]
MIRTGITGIDEMLGSGIPRGSRVLFSLEPGVDARVFMYSTLNAALSQGLRCVIVNPLATEEVFRSDLLEAKGIDIDSFGDYAVILDSRERDRINKMCSRREDRRREWDSLLKAVCERQKTEVVFVYFDLMYEDLGLEAAVDVFGASCCGGKLTLVMENLNLEGQQLVSRFSDDFAFDLIITLKSGYTTMPFFNFFTLEYTSWSKVPTRSIPYLISDGTIRLYIPKIVVTGPASSGKSTFVSNASDRGVSVDRGGQGDQTTVAMDLGWLHLKGFEITIYGTPGKPRFDPIIPQLVLHAMGIVLVIDVTRKDTLERAKELMQLAHAERLPMVVAANKIDLPHSLTEEEIRSILGLREDTPVYFISALRRAEVRHVIESMVDQITRFPY